MVTANLRSKAINENFKIEFGKMNINAQLEIINENRARDHNLFTFRKIDLETIGTEKNTRTQTENASVLTESHSGLICFTQLENQS